MLSGGRLPKTIVLCSLVLVGLIHCSLAATDPNDMAVLRVINNRWGNFLGWNPSSVEQGCDTKLSGVTCTQGRVTAIIMSFRLLNGTIPAEIGSLSALTVLDLSGNKLIGPIPKELGNLRMLTRLYLGNNQLSGDLPRELAQLTRLVDLDLSFNMITGVIDGDFGLLTSLRGMNLRSNRLGGGISVSFGSLTSLVSLDLRSNMLTGLLSERLSGMRSLVNFFISDNRFFGSIPQVFANMTSLVAFEANNNRLYLCPAVDLSNYKGFTWDVRVQTVELATCQLTSCLSDPSGRFAPAGVTGIFQSCRMPVFPDGY